MSDDKIARYYHADRNPEERWHTGIPIRDLTQAEYDRLNDRLKATVDDKDSWWTKTKPRERTDEQTLHAAPPVTAPTEEG